jgi:hypothetical protein
MVMPDLPCYERLLESVDLIVRHPPYSEKSAVIEQCAGEIEEMVRSGGLTGIQGGTLLDILAGDVPRTRRVASSEYEGPGTALSGGPTEVGLRGQSRVRSA